MSGIINSHVKSLNFGYKVDMRENNVKYYNEFAVFKDKHTVEGTNKKGEKVRICTRFVSSVLTCQYQVTKTARHVVIAIGERPHLPTEVSGIELAVTSDDLFTLPKPPGDTLIVGGGYIALESAGFLTG